MYKFKSSVCLTWESALGWMGLLGLPACPAPLLALSCRCDSPVPCSSHSTLFIPRWSHLHPHASIHLCADGSQTWSFHSVFLPGHRTHLPHCLLNVSTYGFHGMHLQFTLLRTGLKLSSLTWSQWMTPSGHQVRSLSPLPTTFPWPFSRQALPTWWSLLCLAPPLYPAP